MKKIIILMAGVFYSLLSFGQVRFNQRFNLRYNLDFADAAMGVQPSGNDHVLACTTINLDSNFVRVQTLTIDSLGTILSNYLFYKTFFYYYGSWDGGFCKVNLVGYALAGTDVDSTGNQDLSLYRFNANGDTTWKRTYSNPNVEIGRSIKSTNDTGFIIVGQRRDTSTLNDDIFLMKTDSSGIQQWQYYFDQSGYDDALSVIQTNNSGYLIGGFFRANGLFQDAMLIKTDSMGNQQWRRIVGDQYSQSVWDVVETIDSNYVITGAWQKNNAPHPGYQFWLMKIEKDSGNIMWSKFYDDSITSKAFHSIIELDDGTLVGAGGKRMSNLSNAPNYGTIFKFSLNGDSLWQRNYLPPNVVNGWGVFNDIIAISDGGFIAVGEAGGDTMTQDTWILKVDSEGCEVFNCLGTGIIEKNEEAMALLVYPNPANNQIQLSLNEMLQQEALLQIFNSLGELIFQKQIPKRILSEQLDISRYANGLYFVKVTGKEISLQAKFVVLCD